jgi:hypothetical protein
MRNVPAPLFAILKSQSARVDTGWLVVRTDGKRFGFTSSDKEFTYYGWPPSPVGDYTGDVYSPANGMSSSAIVSKGDASVDNMEMQVLENDLITESDLKGGLWSNAQVKVFWICPDHPEYGVVPLRGGTLGEVVLKSGQFTTQLRSLFQQLQQPFGFFYTLQCAAQLGDARCKVKLDAPKWQANHAYRLGLLSDAGIGDIIQPTIDNGFWYVAQYTTTNEQAERMPSQPGQGLSGNDDAGPNDDTQVAVGAPPNDLGQFTYQGNNVDIFGIKI